MVSFTSFFFFVKTIKLDNYKLLRVYLYYYFLAPQNHSLILFIIQTVIINVILTIIPKVFVSKFVCVLYISAFGSKNGI